jgi:hypothetical protein
LTKSGFTARLIVVTVVPLEVFLNKQPGS